MIERASAWCKRGTFGASSAMLSLLLLSASAGGDPVAPGNPTIAPTSILPVGLELDTGNSNIYALDANGTDHHAFGILDPSTGAFKMIASVPLSFGYAAIPLSLDSVNQRLYVLQKNGIAVVDLKTGNELLDPNPSAASTMKIDLQSQQMVITPWDTGFSAITPSTGAQTLLSSYRFTGEFGIGVSAVDPVHHVFYTQEMTQQGFSLVAIKEGNGDTAKIALSTPLIGLAYDPSTATLYGITACGFPPSGVLVKINTATGQESSIVSVGGCPNVVVGVPASVLVDDDRHYVADWNGSSITIVGGDVSANRSWYVHALRGEKPAALSAWFHDAGYALGLRVQQVPAGLQSHVILDFGQPASKLLKGVTTYGASGYGRFMPTDFIHAAILQYARGFHDGAGGTPAARVTVVVGTSNAGTAVTPAHGAAWGAMVAAVNADIATSGWSGQIQAVAGIDAEMEFKASPAAVRAWVNAAGGRVADYGDANGCTLSQDTCLPGSGWTKADIAAVAAGGAWPEMYSTAMGDADEWAAVSAYSLSASGSPLTFVAGLSQFEDCLQIQNPRCKGANASPLAAWQHLKKALQQQFGNSAALPAPTTDIEWRAPPGEKLENLQPVPAGELGIDTDTDDVPGVKGASCDAWVGYVDGRLIRVAAGHEFGDPLAGMLWITDGARRGKWIFHTPTSTGPACIVEERHGVLTIRSEAGEFLTTNGNARSRAGRDAYIAAPGNGVYRFDLRAEDFIR
jgi:hypothetical protein